MNRSHPESSADSHQDRSGFSERAYGSNSDDGVVRDLDCDDYLLNEVIDELEGTLKRWSKPAPNQINLQAESK